MLPALTAVIAIPVWAQSGVSGGTLNLTFATQDLKFAVEDMAGKETGLEVRETPTETRIALSATCCSISTRPIFCLKPRPHCGQKRDPGLEMAGNLANVRPDVSRRVP